MQEEFLNICRLLRFQTRGHEKFRKWYIDGRLYHHLLVDKDDPQKGILEIREIDPLTIRKIREIIRERDDATGVEIPKVVEEYYVFNESGFETGTNVGQGPNEIQGIKIALDSISFVHSGLVIDLPASRQAIATPGRFRIKTFFGYLH